MTLLFLKGQVQTEWPPSIKIYDIDPLRVKSLLYGRDTKEFIVVMCLSLPQHRPQRPFGLTKPNTFKSDQFSYIIPLSTTKGGKWYMIRYPMGRPTKWNKLRLSSTKLEVQNSLEWNQQWKTLNCDPSYSGNHCRMKTKEGEICYKNRHDNVY